RDEKGAGPRRRASPCRLHRGRRRRGGEGQHVCLEVTRTRRQHEAGPQGQKCPCGPVLLCAPRTQAPSASAGQCIAPALALGACVLEKPNEIGRGEKKPEPGGGWIGKYLSGFSGAWPGKPVRPPETGKTEIQPPGGLRRRCDCEFDWFTSCLM